MALSIQLPPRAPAASDLYEDFREPAVEARPFVRWWWNGGRVNEDEIRREIELMYRAGIGGVEINTIGMEESIADASVERHPVVDWLSPEWARLVHVAAEACRERGMTTDLIVGSGWPFGARFLAPAEQTQRILLSRVVLQGPRRVRVNVRDVVREQRGSEKAADKGRDLQEPTASRLQFLRLVSGEALAGAFEPGADLTDAVAEDGWVDLKVPAGEHLLLIGTWEAGYTHVKRGAPGADGPVVNHFDATAVRRYLDAMSTALAPAFDGDMGRWIRAMFVDSLELDHANWTGDFPIEFRRRCGYDIAPYLPFVLDAPPSGSGGFASEVRRARYDFCRTLTELFEERFIRTYVGWAEANGVKARIQAYGREAHPLHGSMGVHLPEGETWLWMDKKDNRRIWVESTVANRYVASAANLTGQRLRSFEAMTNAVPVFRETLENFKQGFDLSVLSGLNHPILHGFNYSPPDAGYPGWVQFGSYFSEQNPWWAHFKRFADYAARIGTVMRAGENQASIAVLAPRPDEWAQHGLLYQPFPEVHVPWYQYKLMDSIHQAGYGADYISERILEMGACSGGNLHFGRRSYGVVILEGVSTMEPSAAAGLVRFVEAGGTLVVIGEKLARAPGLHDAVCLDAEVAASMDRMEQAVRRGTGRMLMAGNPPEEGLTAWTGGMLEVARATRNVTFSRIHESLSQVHQRAGDRAVYFLANTSERESISVNARFVDGHGSAFIWDAATGHRSPLAVGAAGEVDLTFLPLESKLIVFDGDEAGPVVSVTGVDRRVDHQASVQTLEGPWQVEFRPSGCHEVFHRELPRLVDLSQADEARLANFGGVLIYRKSFTTPAAGASALDLGFVNGTTAVRLNGESLGVQWWGRRVYDLRGRLREGSNTIEIEVTTVLANQMRSMKDNPVAQRWAWWAPPIEMGLIGPVVLSSGEAEGTP